ncbi:hypothetical protein EUZ85_18910 [Hahella sp. KA22]|uniref:hypothetical protein n=1 Tax=Hahella sp. KA22 TaxID=1628392 RepID=UPI000FDDC27A|nr:hypothetical protein [Hahella sp. KA22]AZZ92683.1 hypothetical protein ENC22_16335 [Hahella sp. KA22]QAY56056.1 hypothetical protein EUZ85_18910 [Hahella sp. KA22]
MQVRLVDHSWLAAGDGTLDTGTMLSLVNRKLEQIKDIAQWIARKSGECALERVLNYSALVTALLRCKESLSSHDDALKQEVFCALNAHATVQLLAAERKIHYEFGHMESW